MNRALRNAATVSLFLLPLFGAELALALTPHDVARLRSVREAVISPEGREIAFMLEVPRAPFEEETGAAWGELHLVGLEGPSRPFVTGSLNISRVQWRPMHREISFVAKRTGDTTSGIYVISAIGGEARRIVTHATDIGEYSWSRDGRQVAFLAAGEQPRNGEDQPPAAQRPKIFEEEPLATEIWIASPEAAAVTPRRLELTGSASTLRWSPVDNRLAVALAPTPFIDDFYMNRRVTIVDGVDGRVITQFENRGKLGAIAWSPDGNHIAAISAVDRTDPSEGRLVVAPSNGGAWIDLTPDYVGQVENIVWRDANTIVWLGSEGVYRTINSIDRRGTGRRQLAGQGPIWEGISLPADGRSIATWASTPSHPNEVFLLRGAQFRPQRMTNHNEWLAGVRLAPQEVITYRARDGLEIEGMLIRPLDHRPGTRVPLILTIHGGPEAHYSNGWLTSYSLPGQAAAARGFAVFYPNYRGSTGRGVEFSRLGQADPAGREFDDFVDGADHLIEIGLADRSRIGVTGGSYGGYATAWASTFYTDRFAAGVMFVGISDLLSKAGTSDIPTELHSVHLRMWPWDNWEFMLERSPIFHVQKARTPLLILHGEDDTRVHPSQSLMLYRYLKILDNTPVRLVLYPGEGHGLRRSLARLDYNVRMLQWFEHYLQGPGGVPPPHALNLRVPADVAQVDPTE